MIQKKVLSSSSWDQESVDRIIDVRIAVSGRLGQYVATLIKGIGPAVEVGSGTGFLARILPKDQLCQLTQTEINPDLAKLCNENTQKECHVVGIEEIGPFIRDKTPHIKGVIAVDVFDVIHYSRVEEAIKKIMAGLETGVKIVIISSRGIYIKYLMMVQEQYPDHILFPVNADTGNKLIKIIPKKSFESEIENNGDLRTKLLTDSRINLDKFKENSGKYLYNMSAEEYLEFAERYSEYFTEHEVCSVNDIAFESIKDHFKSSGGKVVADSERYYREEVIRSEVHNCLPEFAKLIRFEYGSSWLNTEFSSAVPDALKTQPGLLEIFLKFRMIIIEKI